MKTIIKVIGIVTVLVAIVFVPKWSDDYEWHNGTCRECNHYWKLEGTEFLKYDGLVYKYYCPNCHNRMVTHTHYEPIAE